MILKEWKNAVGTKQLRCDMVIATTKMIVMKRCACKMSGGNDVEMTEMMESYVKDNDGIIFF